MTVRRRAGGQNKLNHRGTTLVEMVVTFALLSLFMVSAARVIAYTVSIYHAAKGSSYGLETSTVLANKIIGMVEGAQGDLEVDKGISTVSDALKFTDGTDSVVTIDTRQFYDVDGSELGCYLNIHYDKAENGAAKYEETDFRFDKKAYMGYELTELRFEAPGADYPENVLKMDMKLHSEKYGDYACSYYMKAVDADKVIVN